MLHIFKRRMGLTKRGSRDSEALTVSDVSVNQTHHFTVHETREFVTLIDLFCDGEVCKQVFKKKNVNSEKN